MKIFREGFTICGAMKLAIALRFYATGDFYEALGDMFGIGKSTVMKIIADVSSLIASKLRRYYVRMPLTQDEIMNAKIDFMRLAEFPLCIAAVDGTHVQITSFGGPHAENFRDRRNNFSLNIQLAVSAQV